MNRSDDRQNRATELIRAHGLPRPLALMVVDDTISLNRALHQRRTRSPQAAAIETPPAFSWSRNLALGLVLVFVALATGLFGRVEPAADEPAAAEIPSHVAAADSVFVRTDTDGELIEIAAPDPGLALITYCDRVAAGCRPIELAVPRRAGERLGRFVESAVAEDQWAIRIVRRAGNRAWVIGDGLSPIRPFPARTLPPGVPRIPVGPTT